MPEVGLEDLRVVLDVGRRPLRDAPPEVQDGHPIRYPHDERHVVLDEQDRDPEFGSNVTDRLGHAPRLLGAHTRDRLVEEQEGGLAAQGSAELQALAVAVGQLMDGSDELVVEPHQLGDGVDAPALVALLAPRPGKAKSRRQEARARVAMAADKEVLLDREVRRQRDVLKRATHAEARDAMGPQPGELVTRRTGRSRPWGRRRRSGR